jgi:hypothetical protein
MAYTFEILGVSPVLYFFNYQQDLSQQKVPSGVEYIGSYKCTLDAVLQSVENVAPQRGWDLESVTGTVIDFWMNNIERVNHWKHRLNDAGRENLLVSRLADLESLKTEFEGLLTK